MSSPHSSKPRLAEKHSDPAEALVALFNTHVQAAYNVAFRVLWNGADAEDAVQRAFVQAFRRMGQLDDPAKVRSWLLTIAYREAIAVLRLRRAVPTERFANLIAVDDPATEALQRDLARRLRSEIAALPDGVRDAIILRDLEELSMHDVATALGVGVSAAKMRVARGREQLRVRMAPFL